MYSKLQQFISFFLIFFLLASFSFRVPFIGLLSYTFAKETPFYNLVSIIVEENIYPSIINEIERYAMDIQGVLENTKVVILPTPKSTSPFKIASLNESLYYDGLKGIKTETQFESKLVGTVLIGDLKIPTVFNKNDSSKTIVPYVDFIDKSYIWNNENKYYEISEDNFNGLNAEIWHGVISPNLGNKGSDIIAIKGFFSKNHDFYKGTGNFKTTSGILNGNNSEGIPSNYKPFVFYYDQIRESKALIYTNYLGYNQTLKNKEDLIYNRFSNELATKLQNKILEDDNKNIADMISNIDPTFDKTLMSSGPDLSVTPEIQSRHVIQNSTKKMLEIFNPTTLGEFKKDVHNAGRYNGLNKKVNMDSPSFIISSLDTINTEIIKSITNELEEKIDKLVTSGLARNIAIPTEIRYTSGCDTNYTNFLYGFQASKITKAEDCSIYRGSITNSGTLVEANRGINVQNAESDGKLCGASIKITSGKVSQGISGYWGWNTPLNLMGATTGAVLKIGYHDLKGGIVSVFDIAGSKEITDSSKIADPRDCFDNNYLLTYKEGFIPPVPPFGRPQICGIKYQVPINGKKAVKWSCNTTNSKYNFNKSFNSNYKNPNGEIYLNGISVAGSSDSKFYYKKIKSHIFHKSPTADELGRQVNSMVTPSLPIDKDRYIDFIGAAGNYAKIGYPYIFRIKNTGTKLDLNDIKKKLKIYLDKKSLEVNNIINASDPSSLTNKDLDIYNLLKVGHFPSSTIDFYNDFINQPNKNYLINGESKNVNYIDTIAFAIYWNNLTSISAKYKFIFDYYLNDEIGGNNFKFHLPKNKKVYEIAYIQAPGDARNMYVKLDPETKNKTPYANVIKNNSLINNQLLATNVANIDQPELSGNSDTQFKCAPPEGVPIFEWFPAITCWLGDLLPPKISISGGVCGSTVLGEDLLNPIDFFTEKEKKEIIACSGDINKNGVNDCIENKLNDGSLKLTSDSGKYYYNRNGTLKAEILDKDGKVVRLDNNTYIKFIIDKIEVPLDSTIEFNEINKKTIYDSSAPNEGYKKEINKYISFSELKIRASSGISKYSFSSKSKDSNITFKAVINIKDNENNTIIPLESAPIVIKIRSDQLFLNSSKIINIDSTMKIEELGYSSVVSGETNLFLTSVTKDKINSLYNNINSSTSSNEKVILNLENISKSGNNLEINYPLKIKIEKDSTPFIEDFIVNKDDLIPFHKILAISESGTYKIIIKDNLGLEVNKQIDFIAGVPSDIKIQLGSTVIENEKNITTNLVSIYDSLGNIVSGEYLSLDININGEGINFEQNGNKDISFKMFEGFKTFRLKTTDIEANIVNKLNFSLKNSKGTVILAKTIDIKTLNNINIQVDIPTGQGDIKVGGNKFNFNILLKDDVGNLITDLNSRAYVVIPSIYGKTTTPYITIKGGKAKATFVTSRVAGEQIPVEIQVEGVNNIHKMGITIYPEEAIKLDITLSKNKMEASSSDYSYMDVNLKDRYGNLVFNDNTTTIDFEILPEYQGILTTPLATKNISNGKTNFRIYGTDIPGQGFFKIKSTPDIGKNSFEIEGQSPFNKSKLTVIPGILTSTGLTSVGSNLFKKSLSGNFISKFGNKKYLIKDKTFLSLPKYIRDKIEKLWDSTNTLTIFGVGENVGKIETFYYWNQDKFKATKYNALYSTLLGGQYGDITKQGYTEKGKLKSGYLAGGLIFDKNNRSLAVTTLLNNVYKYDDVITILPEGGIKSIYSPSILTQDVKYTTFFEDNKLNIGIYNESLNTFIGKIFYNFDSNVSLKSCISKSLDFNDCGIDLEKTMIMGKSLSEKYITYIDNGQLILKTSYGKKILIINKDGTINRTGSINIELKEKNTNNYAIFNLKSGNETIGLLGIKFSNGKIDFSRDQRIFDTKKATTKNSILGIIKTNGYGTREIIGTKGTISSIYYNDPFSDKKNLNNFSRNSEYDYENNIKEKGLGWNKGNKTLLEFAAGTSVGDSTKNNMSFSLINIGDPVISLKKIQKKLPGTPALTFIPRNFDSTIGKLLTKDNNNIGYKTFDYNNDSKDDIILIKRDSTISLLENKNINAGFLDKGDLAFIPDLGNKELLLTGNFSGDGYDDIFFINKVGKPFLLQNINKNFIRLSLYKKFNLNGKIIRAESFDMDNDGIDDIVTLDDSGEINIFYGSNNYNFTKKTIGSGYGIKLDNKIRNKGAFIYFDGLTQVKEGGVPSTDIDINEPLIDNLIFVNIPYSSKLSYLETKEGKTNNLLASIPNLSSPEISGGIADTNQNLLEFTNNNNDYLNYVGDGNVTAKTSFIKSEYSEIEGIKVEKIFNDINGGYLSSYDRIKVDVTVKNTSSKTLHNIAYIDSFINIFKLEKNSVEIKSAGAVERKAPSGYDILVNDFSLAPGQEMKMTYYLNTHPIKHSYIQVGLFESGEIGDDAYGDILLKKNEKNCGENSRIYQSQGSRTYLEKIKTPSCDSGKIKLPNKLAKNQIDTNNNGIPDYIDDLQGNTASLAAYSKTELNNFNFDTDGDGIPDREDEAPNYNNDDGGLLNNLDNINSITNDISEQVDTFVDGLGCGFGGGGCFSLPMNWAPLAPGGDPVVLGKLVGDGLNVEEGLPIFSALTWMYYGPVCAPIVWPASPLSQGCSGLGAGGLLGTDNITNFFRLFVTPTLTGAAGIAMCFGPAEIAGCTPPPGSGVDSDCTGAPIGGPLIPYGNCIVIAEPLNACNSDGSDGDPGSVGEVQSASEGYNSGVPGSFGIINGNCSYETKDNKKDKVLDSNFIKEYINYKKTGIKSSSLESKYDFAIDDLMNSSNSSSNALISLDGGIAGEDMNISADINTDALLSGNINNVIDIKMERTWGFPDFLMSWVTRQIEEIKTKLTDWPTIYIVLPDFTGVFDGWGNDFLGGLGNAFDKGAEERKIKEAIIQTKIDTLKSTRDSLDCSGDDFGKCLSLGSNIAKNELLQDGGISFSGIDNGVSSMRRGASGIESVYKFLSNTPLVDIQQEIVYINIPWIDGVDIEKALSDWKLKYKQWKKEIKEATGAWSLGNVCTQGNPIEKKKCEDQNSLNEKVSLNANNLLYSLERNIEILEGYRDFPRNFYKLIKVKEVYLEQILCNLDSIAYLIGGRIGDNGKRFKAWVELYITIKAILKSWQLLVDIFADYDAECNQCKNERDNSLYSQFKVFSLIIPDIPVIQFPKWPDIIIDLHNVRVNLKIYLPDFKFNLRPIILPQLPNLYLPPVPNVNINLPELPLLPELILPQLPDLPSLPRVELPNLPPPPTLPELFSSLEAILEIIKLLVKILCILKSSPLVPEWRAGDQIAFITERQGYLGLDFLNMSLPQFSLPFIDAVKVSSYVNLEFETEFIVELAKQAVSPINSVTNNISNMFDLQFDDLDFSGYTPSDINIGLNNKKTLEETVNKNFFAIYIAKRIQTLYNYIDKNKSVEVDSKSFISLVNKSLASTSVVSNPRYDELRNLWSTVAQMTYSKEDKLIKELQDTNTEKFEAIKDIIKKEIELNKNLGKEITQIEKGIINKIAFENKNNITEYNKTLDKYNAKFIKSAVDLVYGKDTKEIELEKEGDKLVTEMTEGLSSFSKQYLERPEKEKVLAYNKKRKTNKLLAFSGPKGVKPVQTSCQAQAKTDYSFKYKGLYILEGGQSYNLFDYIDVLNGKEKTTTIDFDIDGDEDLLYMVSGKLYLKENLNKSKSKVFVNDAPIVITSNNNKFYNNDVFYESINNFNQLSSSNGLIDASFNSSTNVKINNYRLEFYTIIDKWLNTNNSLYTPKKIKKSIIDAFANIDKITLAIEPNEKYTLRSNLAHITYVGTVPGVELITQSLINIKEEIDKGAIVNITSGTKIYSGNDEAFNIEYYVGDSTISETKYVAKNQNIEFRNNIKVIGLSGKAYIEGLEEISITGLNIRNYIGLPLLSGARIEIIDNEINKNESSHIDIKYFDNTEVNIDLREISLYHLYDLGLRSKYYSIRTKVNNDFYYGKIRSFSKGIFSTTSRSILSSPQEESDLTPPENNLREIKVPIFQKYKIDIAPYIFEEGGIEKIKDIFIDFDLELDDSNDGKTKNDRNSDDSKYKVIINRNENQVILSFGPYDTLVDKKIGLTLIDKNDNIGFKEVDFKVYAPSLSINSYENNLIKGVVDNKRNSIPISFFRFRGGILKPIENKSGNKKTFSFDDGNFTFNLDDAATGVKLEQSGIEVASINEYTGQIEEKSGTLDIKVYPSNSNKNNLTYPKIEVKKSGKTIFTQFIQILNSPIINIIDNFDSLTEFDNKGLYLKFIDKASYNYYKIPEGVLYNPGTLVIYRNSDTKKKALFTIFKDGRINTLNNNYQLIYDKHQNFIKLLLKDKNFNKIIAEILVFIDGGYVIQ